MLIRPILYAALCDFRPVSLGEHLRDARGGEEIQRRLLKHAIRTEQVSRVTNSHCLLIKQAQLLWECLSSALVVLIDFNAHLLILRISEAIAHVDLEPEEIRCIVRGLLKRVEENRVLGTGHF